ncbi:pentapeptide repeat protein [Cyanobacterium stanieri PCC 7202]|uniref:Pentapeptide repeat protein n=1 Tax=Cyanobacterium stanieri (strain ATCC 29140 / PCC 7202) TaxID=292563 RepID=K9YKP3_CYASC|nr:pentapeptide repeat protein [Cyanobacterium stanieri PCC 7202]
MSNAPNNNSQSELTKSSSLTAINNQEKTVSVPPPIPPKRLSHVKKPKTSFSLNIIIFLALSLVGIYTHLPWLGATCATVAFILAVRQTAPFIREWIGFFLTPEERRALIGSLGLVISLFILAKYVGVYRRINVWLTQFKYDEFGSWAEWVGALGQISIAVLAVYVAWQQYVISKDLTIQQNRITQQQTIDTYFQGISDLVLGPDGLLEDWPQERAIAEGRTAAILSSVDPPGKAKILRFLSRSRLITPLKRDSHLGRVILDGAGGYAEDREHGMRVINLGVVLAGNNLMGQDLRWIDLSDANMIKSNLSRCDLSKANLSRTILVEATLQGADLKRTILFYGNYQTATPRDRTHEPNYETGEYTGAVVEKADLTGVKNLTEENRYYCCCWGGEYTRSTIPGGCQGIPNKLENN